MTLTKQQKLDMIRDVELRIAKEELAEMHIRNMKAIEDSDQPLRTLKSIISNHPPIAEKEQAAIYDNAKSSEPEILASTKQKTYQTTNEEKELLEQSKIATQTPFVKDGLDSKTQWTFTGLEKISVRENTPKETSQHNVTKEQMQAFREEYYGGQYNALETLNQHNKENGYITEEQLETFTQEIVESQRISQEILRNPPEDISTKAVEKPNLDLNLQNHFDNAKSMLNDRDAGMER